MSALKEGDYVELKHPLPVMVLPTPVMISPSNTGVGRVIQVLDVATRMVWFDKLFFPVICKLDDLEAVE